MTKGWSSNTVTL